MCDGHVHKTNDFHHTDNIYNNSTAVARYVHGPREKNNRTPKFKSLTELTGDVQCFGPNTDGVARRDLVYEQTLVRKLAKPGRARAGSPTGVE